MYDHLGNLYWAKSGLSPKLFDGKGAAEILWTMLSTDFRFKVKDFSVPNLRRHVQARETIVRNTQKANFIFDTGEKLDWTGFRDDPQAFFDKLNNGTTTIACQALSQIIFETGNNFGNDNGGTWAMGRRDYDAVWIPGDWGWIQNSAYTDDGDWTDDKGRNRGVQGENVFYTGSGLFWGHFKSGIHPSLSESSWWEEINTWISKSGKRGIPQWRTWLNFPTTGLEQ